MTEILCSPQHQPSSSSSIDNDVLQLHQHQAFINHDSLINHSSGSSVALYRTSTHIIQQRQEAEQETGEGDQLSVLAALLTVFRKSLVGCRSISGESCGVEEKLMEIGRPSNVRHVAHVTFDRFDGFLGLPVEFEPEVPRRPPSASTRVFGVSTESMQLSFDSRGNCVPTILLMMQRRLYSQGGLQSEGIFRINPENSQEEYVREQLNNGYIPENIDVHCLAGLIKAWFRELPTGLLDSLSPERIMEAQSEEECTQLVRLLPPTETALLDWAINLMADVAQMEHHNKMNARNIAMVFAPNMTQMSDPLTALMYAVQVMNFLKTLVAKTLREREESVVDSGPVPRLEPSDEDGHPSTLKPINIATNEFSEEEEANMVKEPLSNHVSNSASLAETMIGNKSHRFLSYTESIIADENVDACYTTPAKSGVEGGNAAVGSGRSNQPRSRRTKSDHLSNSDNTKKGSRKYVSQPAILVNGTAEKSKELSVISRVNSHSDRVEVWR